MKGVRILVSFTLGVLWLAGGLWLPAGLLGPGGPEVRAAEPGEVPAGLTAAEWQTLQGQLAKLTAGGGEPEDWFGCSVAAGPDVIVAGAPGVDVEGQENEGAAYVFYRDEGGTGNWGPVVRLTAADGADVADVGALIWGDLAFETQVTPAIPVVEEDLAEAVMAGGMIGATPGE